MKNSILLLYLILSYVISSGQTMIVPIERCTNCGNNPTVSDAPSTSNNYVPFVCDEGDIEGDFSRRICCQNKWHKGIDISPEASNGDLSDAILALESGIITRFRAVGYKYLIIDGQVDYGYGHIFDARDYSMTTPVVRGDFILWKDSLGTDCIIDKENCRAYSTRNNRPVLTSGLQGVMCGTIYTQNTVSAGDRIAPLGTSGNNNFNYEAHLHLYNFKNASDGITNDNCYDPLEALTETSPDYKFYLSYNESITKNFTNWNDTSKIKYDEDFNTIGVRAWMSNAIMGRDSSRYANIAMNLNWLEIRMKEEDGSDYEVVSGANFDSKFYLHAREDTDLYPDPEMINRAGNLTTTGQDPRCYDDNVGWEPWDNFYWSDWSFKRNNQNQNSTCPGDDMFSDGNYSLKITAQDVNGTFYLGPHDPSNNNTSYTPGFSIDHWKPYIKEVQFESLTGDLFYHNFWQCSSSCLSWSQNSTNSSVTYDNFFGQTCKLTVETSEAMDHLTVSIPYLNITDQQPSMTSSDRKTWTFEFDIVNINSVYDEIRFFFGGEDKNGNELVAFDGSNLTGCKTIPYRDTKTTWNNPDHYNYGTDSVHVVFIGCSGRRPIMGDSEIQLMSDSLCLSDSEVSTSYNIIMRGVIDVDPAGGIAPYEIQWTDGNTDFYRSGLNYGTYCFELSDAYCCVMDSCISFECPNLLQDTTIVHHCSGHSPWEGEIHLAVNSFTTVQWLDGSMDHTRTNLAPGSYTVYLSLNDPTNPNNQCYEQHSFEILTIDPNIELIEHLTVIKEDCDHDGSIDITVWNGTYPSVPLQYQWSNGASTQDIDDLQAGRYCVTIGVGASCGDQVHCFDVEPVFTVSHLNKDAMFQHPSSCDAQDGWIGSYSRDIVIDPPTTHTIGKHLEDENNNVIPPTQIFTHDYLWENLGEGDYYLTYITAEGCKARDTFMLRGYDSPSNHLWSGVDSACYGIPTGAAWVFMNTDTALYNFVWSNGVVHDSMQYSLNDNILTGQYCVTITPVETNCDWDTCLYVPQRPYYGPLALDSLRMEKTCPFQNTGKIYSRPSGGTPPYKVRWSDGAIGANRSHLSGGWYHVTLEDDCDRMVMDSILVAIFPEMNLSLQAIPGCPEDGGTVSVSVTGGSPGYTYQWNTGSTGIVLTGRPDGNYTVTVTDSEGCYQSKSIQLTNHPEIDVSLSANDLCRNDYTRTGNPYYNQLYHTGSVTLTINSGDEPFQYRWSTGATTKNLSGITSTGTYRVTVTDRHDCEKIFTSPNVGNSFREIEWPSQCRVEFLCGGTEQMEWQEDITSSQWIDCKTLEHDCPIFGKVDQLFETDQCYRKWNEETCDREVFLPDQDTLTDIPFMIEYGDRFTGLQSGSRRDQGDPRDCFFCVEATYCRVGGEIHFLEGPTFPWEGQISSIDCAGTDTIPGECTLTLLCKEEELSTQCCDDCVPISGNPSLSCGVGGPQAQFNICDDPLELILDFRDKDEDGTVTYTFETDTTNNRHIDRATEVINILEGRERRNKPENLKEINGVNLGIMPNPASRMITVQMKYHFNDLFYPISCNIYNSIGHKVAMEYLQDQKDEFTIDINNLVSGTYLVVVNYSTGLLESERFIKI